MSISSIFLTVIPNLLILFSFVSIAKSINKNTDMVEDYVEEFTLCIFLLIASNLSHIIWFLFDYRFLSYMIDPLNFAIVSSIAYKLWKEENNVL